MNEIFIAKIISIILLAIALFISVLKKKNVVISVSILIIGLAVFIALNSFTQ